MSGCVYGELPEKVRFRELDALMEADLLNGQKTGHFLDQQENRGRIRPYCRNARVLDLCCHTGGFTVHAGLYGAKSIKSVDVSQSALDMLMGNAELNGVDHLVEPVCENVFDLVKRESDAGEVYDFVICDPPAFSKSRKTLDAAYRGYKELNYRCMKMIAPGGYLASFSCSQFMTAPLFLQMLREAAADAGRQVQLLEILMQSRDHAAAIYSETNWYLKGYIVRVL
jgi:23S rRNA (cytosine1962-C5)-methyltransferase